MLCWEMLDSEVFFFSFRKKSLSLKYNYHIWFIFFMQFLLTDLVFQDVYIIVGSWRTLFWGFSEVGRQCLHVEPEILGIWVTLRGITRKKQNSQKDEYTHIHTSNNNHRLNYSLRFLALCVELQQLGKNDPVISNQLLNHEFHLIQLVLPCGLRITERNQSGKCSNKQKKDVVLH